MNCAAWALAEVAGLPAGAMIALLRPYADRGWVEYDAGGLITSVTMPEVAVALRLYYVDNVRRDADARRWPIVAETD